MPRRAGSTRVISRPSMTTRPLAGASRPAMTCSVVVLPQPDGPSRVRNSPCSTARSIGPTAVASPYFLTIRSSLRTGSWAIRPSPAENFLVPALPVAVAVGELRHVVEAAPEPADSLEILIAHFELLEVGREVLHHLHVGRRIAILPAERDLLVGIECSVD